MGPRWKLEVEGLGKIERAEVEVRPLMLFVGENNSGKSYLATLLWGILTLHDVVRPNARGTTFSACDEWMAARLQQLGDEVREYVLSADERGLFLQLFNEMLAEQKSTLLKGAFDNPDVSASKIQIHDANGGPPLSMKLQRRPGDIVRMDFGSSDKGVVVALGALEEELRPEATRNILIRYLCVYAALGDLSGPGHSQDSWGLYGRRAPIFLPASRSGFMLLYKSAVRRRIQSLRRTAEAEESAPDLTLPAITLLDLLGFGVKNEKGTYADEATFLEMPLQGRVELSSGIGVNEYHYRPVGGDTRLTMSLSSSLVTELAPIIVVLRHMRDFPVLIIEEPEAHLHPKMQRHLARTIVRLIRKGLYVWVTTHSVDFCQQINNFIKMGESPKRAELQKHLGYEEHEYLTLDDVSGYGFTLKDGGEKSVVGELKKTAEGLSMPTFNEELLRLAKEVLYLQGETTE